MNSPDFYELLGVSRRAGKAEIKKAFYRLAHEFHPDKKPGDVGAVEQFNKINEAYQTLSNKEKKFRYDQLNFVLAPADKEQHVFYMHQTASRNKILVNEEVEISFAFPSDGRFFKREKFNGWFLSSGPIVEHQEIIYEGRVVKQTVLKYVLSAQMTGKIIIPAAAVTIQSQRVEGRALEFTVEANACYFKEGEAAGTDPYQVTLYSLKEIKTEQFIKTIRQEHIVLVPRSNVAAYVQSSWRYIDRVLKVVGAAILYYSGVKLLLAAIISILITMMIKRIYFKIKNAELPRARALQYPLIKKYLQQGYEIGIEGIEWPWKVWYNERLKKRILK